MNLKAFIFILLFIPCAARSQWVSDIKTESDWEYYFKSGIIDYNSYQLLRELAEGTEISDTANFIVSTLGISPVEIIDRLNYADIRPQETIAARDGKTPSPWSGRVRLGSEIAAGGQEHFALASIKSGDVASELKIRDENGNRVTERRFIKLEKENNSFILGNFTTDIGCGLSIGRFDYRPLSLESEDNDLNEFLFPDNSYYNGLKAEFSNRYKLIYSVKKYNNLYKNTFGTALATDIGSTRAGFAGAVARLSAGSENSVLGSGSVFMASLRHGLKGEIAYSGSGPGITFQAARANLVLRGWYYDNGYINLQSSGFSHPDYQSYTIDYSETSFRQPQRGETGFYAYKIIGYKRLQFGNAAEFWKNPRSRKIQYNNSVLARYDVTSAINAHMYYTIYNRDNVKYDRLESGFRFDGDFDLEARTYIKFLKKAVATSDSKLYIMLTLPLAESMSLAARLRWRFDGLFDYFLEERLLLKDGLFLKATYRWNENLGRDLGALYIYMENRF